MSDFSTYQVRIDEPTQPIKLRRPIFIGTLSERIEVHVPSTYFSLDIRQYEDPERYFDVDNLQDSTLTVWKQITSLSIVRGSDNTRFKVDNTGFPVDASDWKTKKLCMLFSEQQAGELGNQIDMVPVSSLNLGILGDSQNALITLSRPANIQSYLNLNAYLFELKTVSARDLDSNLFEVDGDYVSINPSVATDSYNDIFVSATLVADLKQRKVKAYRNITPENFLKSLSANAKGTLKESVELYLKISKDIITCVSLPNDSLEDLQAGLETVVSDAKLFGYMIVPALTTPGVIPIVNSFVEHIRSNLDNFYVGYCIADQMKHDEYVGNGQEQVACDYE